MAPLSLGTAQCSDQPPNTGDGLTYGQSITNLAQYCCDNGVDDQNTQFCPAPTSGSMCANAGDFDANAVTTFGFNCAALQLQFLLINLYGDDTVCDAMHPQAPLPWGAFFAIGAAQCCGGGDAADVCSASIVSPCANSTDFEPQSTIVFDGNNSQPCGFALALLYGTNASMCNDELSGGGGGGGPRMSEYLRIASRYCCGTGEPNYLCGTPAPTPEPLPRTGTAEACGGAFDAFRLDTPGAGQCTGTPFESGVLDRACAAHVDSDNRTQHMFLVSNGGICIGFSTEADCQTAVANIQSIVDGTSVSSLVGASSPDAQCLLINNECAIYNDIGVSVLLDPDCGCDDSGAKGKKNSKGCTKGKSAGKSAGTSKKTGKGKKSSSGLVATGSTSTVSGTVVAVAIAGVVVLAAVMLVAKRRSSRQLHTIASTAAFVPDEETSWTVVSNPVFDVDAAPCE